MKAYTQEPSLEQQRGCPDETGQYHGRCQRIIMDKRSKRARVCNRKIGNRCLFCFEHGSK